MRREVRVQGHPDHGKKPDGEILRRFQQRPRLPVRNFLLHYAGLERRVLSFVLVCFTPHC